jgi:hypothetical protein
MFNYRPIFEPMLRLLLPFFGKTGGHYHYDPWHYERWAWLPIILAGGWLLVCVVSLLRKPSEDRRIDRELLERSRESARGAPLQRD